MARATLREPVKYVDPTGQVHTALVTAVWSAVTINVVLVSGTEVMKDTYGRQIERATSVTHASTLGRAHGNYWFKDSPDEKLDDYVVEKAY